MLRNMICGIAYCSPLVLENIVQSNHAITCPMMMRIWMIVTDDWFLFLAQPTFLKESGLMRRLNMEGRVRPSPAPNLGEPGKLRGVLIFMFFIIPSTLHGGLRQMTADQEMPEFLTLYRRSQIALVLNIFPLSTFKTE